ncbi:MAG: hypothetical protein ACXWPS_00310 [Ktedonobacteraceae bacterium]
MTRKDSEKETDRPHYYSQFWLDVAAGRTVIGAAKGEDEIDLVDDESDMSEPEIEPTPLRRAGRNHAAGATDGYTPSRTQTVVEPAFEPEEFVESIENDFDQVDEVEDLELPDLDEVEEEIIIPEAVVIPDEAETEEEEEQEEEEDIFFDEDIEEDEDDDSWGARGRKKPKPGRQVKAPKPTKKPKREPRRGF